MIAQTHGKWFITLPAIFLQYNNYIRRVFFEINLHLPEPYMICRAKITKDEFTANPFIKYSL